MTVTIDTTHVPPDDRAEAVRNVIWDKVVRVDIDHHPENAKISAVGSISHVGRLAICSVRSNATTIRRTPMLVRDDTEPYIFLGLQISGSSMVVQGNREAVLNPGDFALYDTTAPYTLLNDGGIHQHYFRIPRADLALPHHALERVTAVRLSTDSPVAALAATYFGRLADCRHELSADDAEEISTPSIELLRAVVATRLRDRRLAHEPLEATLQYRIMEYVRAHLAERDLTAARIARAHNISVRYLYATLARSGISLGDWVRTRRLEECRKDLARPRAQSMTIEAVAHRWGFTNAAHFSRVFKDAYGVTPREWRAVNARRGHRPQS
ncbi:helix-turn-helix domain-containing protein [Yinghuangia soli]|uniref:Helix-turn-helix domain-containing protein n=1 Tax=Yinghuangia soli TaxID=2908204 RepID=A0AA41Q4N6_9ACTN|nr:helix-turn-helix domain-containing protein [Yinghuangia soli]MCF2531483.1 helix-turn-helix domain-containing protein [Yinghuangia soli]